MSSDKNILYTSSFCSSKVIDFLFRTSTKTPLLSIQKFHRLFAEGFVENGCHTTVLSGIPVSYKVHKKLWWRQSSEEENGLRFNYPPFINLPYVRHLFITLFSTFFTLKWRLKNKKKESVVICDILNISISMGSLLVAKVFGIRTCAIVTDLPAMLIHTREQRKSTVFERIATFISSRIAFSFDTYVILTQQMDSVINPRGRPSIVIEGLVDSKINSISKTAISESPERIILYSGGIYEMYGIRKLLEAFMKLNEKDLRLHIYGAGELEADLNSYMEMDHRIAYYGVVPNHEIIQKQKEAALLINPRPSMHEFTKYSFPSKNMEYLVSGTPLLTTHLPGMPIQYNEYVYFIEDESIDGFIQSLNKVLSLPKNQLTKKGEIAKEFVLNEKNNIIQSRKVIDLLKI